VAIIIYACLNTDCSVYFFRTRDGNCATCGEQGHRVGWALKQAGRPMRDLWWFRRVCPNGRLEVACRACSNLFWLTERELRSWEVCPHCVKFWRLPGDPRNAP
jgi:hypothetical protein